MDSMAWSETPGSWERGRLPSLTAVVPVVAMRFGRYECVESLHSPGLQSSPKRTRSGKCQDKRTCQSKEPFSRTVHKRGNRLSELLSMPMQSYSEEITHMHFYKISLLFFLVLSFFSATLSCLSLPPHSATATDLHANLFCCVLQ